MKYLLLLMLLSAGHTQASDTLTLTRCHQLAEENFPLLQQNNLLAQIADINTKNLETSYLPQFNLNGQATYQSDVVSFPLQLPGAENQFPELPHEQARVTLEISQTLYDGGAVKANREVMQNQLLVDRQQVEIKRLQLKKQVNALYFSILLLRENKAILTTSLELLDTKYNTIRAALQGGVMLESEANKIQMQILKVRQQIHEVEANRQAALQSLGIILGIDPPEEVQLHAPDMEAANLTAAIARPELTLFDYQHNLLQANEAVIQTKSIPKFSVFFQGGAGYPNPLNFFDDSLSPYYIAGVRFNWNLLHWNNISREQQILRLRSAIIRTERENFNQNLNASLASLEGEILKMETLARDDEQIVTLQEKNIQIASSQLDHGIITSSDFLEEVNSGQQAKLNMNLHQTRLMKAKADYLTEKGFY